MIRLPENEVIVGTNACLSSRVRFSRSVSVRRKLIRIQDGSGILAFPWGEWVLPQMAPGVLLQRFRERVGWVGPDIGEGICKFDCAPPLPPRPQVKCVPASPIKSDFVWSMSLISILERFWSRNVDGTCLSIYLLLFRCLEGHCPPFSYLEPALVRTTVTLKNQVHCRFQEYRGEQRNFLVPYHLLRDWTRK